jgi:hypothetical protein
MKNNLEIEIPKGINGAPEEEWYKRLSPNEYSGLEEIKQEIGEELEIGEECIGGCDIKKNRDLEKLREYEKENPNKIKLTKEDKQLIKQQKKIGKDIDNAFKREHFLRNNIETMPISDYTKILYRLPLTKKQMKDMYVKILDDAKNNNLT